MRPRSSSFRRAAGLSLLLIAACLWATAPIAAVDYQQGRSKAVTKCQAIDPSASQSGLLFNPDGYRSFYVRSQCFQEAAVQFRDQTLCEQVKERRSLFSSSWGYSAARCRQLVSEGTASDRIELEKMKSAYATGGMTLRDLRVQRNGNGRDTDIIPMFSGSYAHGYTLRFEIVPPDAPGSPALIHSNGYYVDEKSNLNIYVRQVDIKQRFPAFVLNRPYTVRATIVLDVGTGSQSGYWSDAFVNEVFPVRGRSQSIERPAVF